MRNVDLVRLCLVLFSALYLGWMGVYNVFVNHDLPWIFLIIASLSVIYMFGKKIALEMKSRLKK